VITAALALLIWAIKWAIKQMREWANKLVDRVDDLNKNVSQLNGILIKQAVNQKNIKEHCGDREKYVDGKFEKYDDKLENHERRIQDLEK